MGQLVFQATAGGQVALVGPNPSSSFSINVPAVNSTLATLAAQTFSGTQTFSVDASISGLTVGKGTGSIASNTVLGNSALATNTTGNQTIAIGQYAGYTNSTGVRNAFGGYASGYYVTGSDNTSFGANALSSSGSASSGASNTAIGSAALQANTASNNTAVGYQAGYSNTTASNGTFVGNSAGYSNSTGAGLTAIGDRASYGNTTGIANTSLGGICLYTNSTGGYNTAIGNAALFNNTTASNNTAVGYQAGYSNSTGNYCTFVGNAAGYASTGNGNTCFGHQAGTGLTSGTNNSLLGIGAGYAITTGSKNTVIGAYSGNQGGLDIRTASNYIVLSDGDGNPRGIFDGSGNYIVGGTVACNGASNRGTFTVNGSTDSIISLTNGNSTSEGGYVYFDGTNIKIQSSRTSSRVYVTAQTNGVYLANGGIAWIANSDERLKENLVPISDALNKVNSLRSVTGNYISDKEKQSKSFLIAQDVQAVLPEAVDASDPEKLGVAYTDVIPLLVAAIKELKAEIDQLKGSK